jgi:hypothetical protein
MESMSLNRVVVSTMGMSIEQVQKIRLADYDSWHADIKPENIIVVRGKYKLADPGFARFKKAAQGKSAAPPQILVHGGTDTYGTLGLSIRAYGLICLIRGTETLTGLNRGTRREKWDYAASDH